MRSRENIDDGGESVPSGLSVRLLLVHSIARQGKSEQNDSWG